MYTNAKIFTKFFTLFLFSLYFISNAFRKKIKILDPPTFKRTLYSLLLNINLSLYSVLLSINLSEERELYFGLIILFLFFRF